MLLKTQQFLQKKFIFIGLFLGKRKSFLNYFFYSQQLWNVSKWSLFQIITLFLDSKFIGQVENSNFAINKFAIVKVDFVKVFLLFWVLIKEWYHLNLLIFITSKHIFGWVHCVTAQVHSWRGGGIQVLAGVVPSSQAVGSILRTPLPVKLAVNIWQKGSAANSLQWKNTLTYLDWTHFLKSWIQ